jgi:hypothetical protein
MEQSEIADPMLLIAVFQRNKQYPRDAEGVIMLAQGLVKASEATGIAMEAIVEACRVASEYCPTDYDLLKVAREMKSAELEQQEHQRQATLHQRWEKECGPAKPFVMTYDKKRVDAVIQRRREMWGKLRETLKVEKSIWPAWNVLAEAAHRLGYDDYAKAWGFGR